MAVIGQVGSAQHREAALGGPRAAGDIGVSFAVHRDSITTVVVRTADIAGIDQGRSSRVDFGNKGIIFPVVGEIGSYGEREGRVDRNGNACDVSIAGAIHRDGVTQVI